MLVKRIRSRGANIVVEAHGEVLFAETADLGRWKNAFSRAITAATVAAAPVNKRPRWAHYGKPLKTTFTSTSSTRLTKGGGRFYIAVGSKAPYAYYVDQGTGIYAGKGPYRARILPPWQPGSPSLYEASWRPGGPGQRKVIPVMIKGQKGQHFFDEGLKLGFKKMHVRSIKVPGEGTSAMAMAANTFPTGLGGVLGPGRQQSPAFIAQLEDWRSWRDKAWKAGRVFNRSPLSRRPKDVQARMAARAASIQKDREDYLASIEATESRSIALAKKIAAEKARKEAGRREREAEQAAFNLANAERMADARALLVRNNRIGTKVSVVQILRAGVHTGWAVLYTDKQGLKHKEIFE